MNREDYREVLSLARFDYHYFRRHHRSLLAVFKALRRVPGTISMIERRRVSAGRTAIDTGRIASKALVS